MDQTVLGGYEPAAVLHFFEEICAIPHVSGDERAIADYLEAFACARGLDCYRDAVHNVFVRLPASAGHEDAPAVMLQGHTDMVGEKDADSPHDFATDGLRLRVVEHDGEPWIAATGTTLGGDDGIAVAMMLAVLDCPPEPHPAVECLFTVSEETGLEGAWAFDPVAAGATARTVINLDSEDEGVITAGCAGGVRTDLAIPVEAESTEDLTSRCTVNAETGVQMPMKLDAALTVSVSGLSGGHSGVQIHEGHLNAIRVLGLLLSGCGVPVWRLCAVSGGGKDNAIPRDATATVCLPAGAVESFRRGVLAKADEIRAYPDIFAADRHFACTALPTAMPAFRLTEAATGTVVTAILLSQSGVLAMNPNVEGLVAHSRNLGILSTTADGAGKPTSVCLTYSSRAALGAHLDASEAQLTQLAALLSKRGGTACTATHRSRYPGWDYAPTSLLRETWLAASERLLAKTPRVDVIHAGLECGILCDKLTVATGTAPDIISVGPSMRDIHTPREILSIPSTHRTYRLLTTVLSELA